MNKSLLLTAAILICALSSYGQSTIYSEIFDRSLGEWTSYDYNGNAGTWVYSTNPFNSADQVNYGPQTFEAPNASLGFALILSNLNTNSLNTDLTSHAINCSGQNFVGLQFYEFMAIVSQASALVYVSTDSVNWTQVYDAAANTQALNPQLVQFDISPFAANQPTVYIKFNYQATDDGWWTIDDIKLLALPALDIKTVSINTPAYTGEGNYYIPFTVESMGGVILNSFTATFSYNDTQSVAETFTGLSLDAFDTTSLVFSSPAPLTSPNAWNLQVVSSAPNGGVDANPANDTANQVLITLSHLPVKSVLLEEFSTVPCGYCPGGFIYIEAIMGSVDSAWAIPVTLHAGFSTDAMTTADDNTLANAFSPGVSPQAAIDRVVYPQQPDVAIGVAGLGGDPSSDAVNDWKAAAEAEQPVLPPASIACYNTFDSVTRLVTAIVSSTFYGPVSGSFRMNCYIVEDSVVGSGSGYNQHSYYYYNPTTNNPWLHVGDYSSADEYATIPGFVHHRVERKLMNGTWGTAGAIPDTTTDGGRYSQTYTYTLPTDWRSKFISLVPFVYEYNTDYMGGKNEVMNVLNMSLNSADSSVVNLPAAPSAIQTTPAFGGAITLYPNPARDVVYLNYSLDQDSKLSFEVYNVLGQLVTTLGQSNFNKGNYSTLINTAQFTNGIYFVTVRNEGNSVQTLKFVIAK